MYNFRGKPQSTNSPIPTIRRDGPLLTRLLPIALGGFDAVLDKKGRLYFRLLVRLIDKSFEEYAIAKEYIDQEIRIGNKLAYRFSIINHLENCVNAISRAAKTLKTLIEDKNKLLEYMSKESLAKIMECDTLAVRNRVEHIDEDIQKGRFRGTLFLDVDNNYEKFCINNKCVTVRDLVSMIENYHEAVLEICINLPKK